MYSFRLKNYTINKGLKVNEQVGYWTIHFFSATPAPPIWTFPLTNSDDNNVFKFAKQDPNTNIQTNVGYSTTNSNVSYSVYFLLYKKSTSFSYYSLSEDLSVP